MIVKLDYISDDIRTKRQQYGVRAQIVVPSCKRNLWSYTGAGCQCHLNGQETLSGTHLDGEMLMGNNTHPWSKSLPATAKHNDPNSEDEHKL